MLTIEEIKKESDTGNTVEFECIDIKAISTSSKTYAEALLSEPLIFSHIFANKIIFKNKLFIYEAELQCFRIKRPTPTFDDLIDATAKAVKDGVIFSAEIFESAIYIYLDSSAYDFCKPSLSIINDLDSDMKRIPEVIDKINSLYTETFVIESEEDVVRSKIDSITKLTNGQELQCRSSNLLIYRDENDRTVKLSFCILKGATVTQKRGAI